MLSKYHFLKVFVWRELGLNKVSRAIGERSTHYIYTIYIYIYIYTHTHTHTHTHIYIYIYISFFHKSSKSSFIRIENYLFFFCFIFPSFPFFISDSFLPFGLFYVLSLSLSLFFFSLFIFYWFSLLSFFFYFFPTVLSFSSFSFSFSF